MSRIGCYNRETQLKENRMSGQPISPLVLVILDGWGYREDATGNAIAGAAPPVMQSLWDAYPKTLLQAAGKAVGLPKGQMGNSEVGHLTIGAGRVVPQELVRISDAFEDGSILSEPTLVALCEKIRVAGTKLHLIGLCSNGGVHAHIDHLLGLLDLAKVQGLQEVCVHAIADGRDTLPHAGASFMAQIENHMQRVGVGRITTLSGRYYAMDRDKRWDRVEKAYRVLTEDGPGTGLTAAVTLQQSYSQGITDEFIEPVRLQSGAIQAGDGVIFFNFRPDRSRQLTQALISPKFSGFARPQVTPLHLATFTQYDASLADLVQVVFLPQDLNNLLGQVVAAQGLQQFRISETEKYAHVTYFFDGGNEEGWSGTDRHLVNSPPVATYDLKPEMSAQAVTEAAIAAIEKGIYSLVVLNYANPDMVGHTGNYAAAEQAVLAVDRCLGQLVECTTRMGGTLLITADHGNAEYMWDEQGNPWTAHTTNLVPFLVVEGEKRKIPQHGGAVRLREGGGLADIAPTILEILQIPQPPEMTGRSLLLPADYEVAARGEAVTLLERF
jgi:2,3-bisphosphoglycerate-independent phosphoglycerate mutase